MRSRSFLILIIWGFIAVTISAQPLRKAVPVSDAGGENYYAVDSDDPVTDPQWHPTYNFVDTSYQPSSWHRIYPGSQSIPLSQPQGICWRGTDTTNNTFAGPMPIGFAFDFYGVNYDSVYLSSNGYIGFGNFVQASGGDGPAYSTFHCATFPDTLSPKSIAAFLMTDGEMVRTNFDSSRAFYRISQSSDSFFITIYNYYHVSGTSTNNTVHKFRADIQIVLAKADSSITFHYRKFNGAVTIGMTSYSAETVFRNGCMPNPCTSNAAVIGVQNAARTGGTTYLSNSQFASPGTAAELHSGLAVKFKRWRNICRADSIIWPPPNWEIMVGDSFVPVAAFRNMSGTPQTFYCIFRVRNIRTGLIVYQSRDSVLQLGSNQTERILFPTWKMFNYDGSSGAFVVEAIASPYKNGNQFIGDYWPNDDTLRQRLFEIERTDNFSDFNNNFSSPVLTPGTIPNALQWVDINAEVVDGDLNTYSPPPPRGLQGDPSGVRLNSPVIKMDRLDANGLEYDHCAFGGVDTSRHNTIGDGGTGDTIISFPIILSGVKSAVLGFSYERSGKKSYPRWYDLATAVGPERTITAPDTTQIYRSGDSLEVEFGDSLQTENITRWNEKLAIDGGKDFNFRRVYVPIDSSYCTNHFRFRVRLKGKNDFEPGNPGDDYDEWYLDNFVVVANSPKPEIEVSWVRIAADWPWERVPASQACSVPVEVMIANNGGGGGGGAFGLAVLIRKPVSGQQDPLYVYSKLITIPGLAAHSTHLVTSPKWNARQAGPGPYTLEASLLPTRYDDESQNDATSNDFTMNFDSSYVYDNGVNDAPGFFKLPGIGIKMWEPNPANPVGGSATGTGSGSIASKFTVYQRDTLVGVQLWLGSFNQSPDPIRIVVRNSLGNVPGDTISGGCASFQTERGGYWSRWDGWSLYTFPCGPILIEPGEYWMCVSQLAETGIELGVTAYKSSCDWTVYDPSPNLSHKFVVNYPQMINKFAYENTALSNHWLPFYFPYGDSTGKAGFSFYESSSAYGKTSTDCNKNYNYFHAQGSWIPLIRPYFGLRTWGSAIGETICVSDCQEPLISRAAVPFGTLFSCASETPVFTDSILIFDRCNCRDPNLHKVFWHIEGDAYSVFSTVGDTAAQLNKGQSMNIVIQFRPQGIGLRTAQLIIHNRSAEHHNWDTIPLTAEFNDGVVIAQGRDVGFIKVGTSKCVDVQVINNGTIDDTITSITIAPGDPTIFISKVPPDILKAGSYNSLTVCYAAYDTGAKSAVVTIKSNPCNRVRDITFSGTGVIQSLVDNLKELPTAPTLLPNRPNPFADETTIDFDIAQSGHTRLIITDMLGRVCAVIADEHLAAGHYSKVFSAKGLTAGMYVCVLECNGVVVRRMVDVAR